MDAKPQVIKVSSKRQITIPAKLYQALGFTDHAWCVPLGDGLYICPAVEGEMLGEDAVPSAPRIAPAQPAGETPEERFSQPERRDKAASAVDGPAVDAVVDGTGEPQPSGARSASRSGDAPSRVRPLLGIASEPAIRDDKNVGIVVAAVRETALDYPAIKKIFLFGAFARGDYDEGSRVDLRLELNEFGSFGLHDLMVFSRAIEQATARRVNVVSASVLTNQELAAAIEHDKVLVFER